MKTETSVKDNILTVERTYDAARSDVWEAWIDAAKTTHWWGCANTSKVASTIETEAGGRYQHMMTIDGVGDHLIDGRFIEFTPPEALEYTMPGFGEGPDWNVRVTFTAMGDQTRVTLTQSHVPEVLHGEVQGGWSASFERLARFFEGERRAA